MLTGVMEPQGRKADLHNALAQQDQTDCTDQTENEIGLVIHEGERIAGGGKGRHALHSISAPVITAKQ